MSRIRVAPIVEGYGDVKAVPELLRRVWYELLAGAYIEILKPIRQPRTKLVRKAPETGESAPHDPAVSRAVRLAALKLDASPDDGTTALVLLLIDANSDCPARLGPSLLHAVKREARECGSTVVLANVEFESWFVAAAGSLSDHLALGESDPPQEPESCRAGKAWVEERFRSGKYSETVDQVRLAARMDLGLCRSRSASFDKLCRELERFR